MYDEGHDYIYIHIYLGILSTYICIYIYTCTYNYLYMHTLYTNHSTDSEIFPRQPSLLSPRHVTICLCFRNRTNRSLMWNVCSRGSTRSIMMNVGPRMMKCMMNVMMKGMTIYTSVYIYWYSIYGSIYIYIYTYVH